jgi:hypothetical protein
MRKSDKHFCDRRCQSRHTFGNLSRSRLVDAGGDPETDKLCRACRQVRPQAEFHRNRSTWDGLAYDCKICRRSEKR